MSSLLSSAFTSLSGGLTPQDHGKAASASGRPRRQLHSMERVSFLLNIPGESILLVADSDWLALPSLNQPCGFGECLVLRRHLMTLTKTPGGVALQTHDAGRQVRGYRVVPSYKYPIQDSTYKSKKYLPCCVSACPDVFYRQLT